MNAVRSILTSLGILQPPKLRSKMEANMQRLANMSPQEPDEEMMSRMLVVNDSEYDYCTYCHEDYHRGQYVIVHKSCKHMYHQICYMETQTKKNFLYQCHDCRGISKKILYEIPQSVVSKESEVMPPPGPPQKIPEIKLSEREEDENVEVEDEEGEEDGGGTEDIVQMASHEQVLMLSV